MKKKLYIILSIFLFSIIVSYVDAVIKPDYFIKILVKIFFFLALPIIYFVMYLFPEVVKSNTSGQVR